MSCAVHGQPAQDSRPLIYEELTPAKRSSRQEVLTRVREVLTPPKRSSRRSGLSVAAWLHAPTRWLAARAATAGTPFRRPCFSPVCPVAEAALRSNFQAQKCANSFVVGFFICWSQVWRLDVRIAINGGNRCESTGVLAAGWCVVGPGIPVRTYTQTDTSMIELVIPRPKADPISIASQPGSVQSRERHISGRLHPGIVSCAAHGQPAQDTKRKIKTRKSLTPLLRQHAHTYRPDHISLTFKAQHPSIRELPRFQPKPRCCLVATTSTPTSCYSWLGHVSVVAS